jgi:hypothetical protein
MTINGGTDPRGSFQFTTSGTKCDPQPPDRVDLGTIRCGRIVGHVLVVAAHHLQSRKDGLLVVHEAVMERANIGAWCTLPGKEVSHETGDMIVFEMWGAVGCHVMVIPKLAARGLREPDPKRRTPFCLGKGES